MARQARSNKSTAPTTDEATTTNTEEAPVAETTTEAPVAEATEAEQATDLTAFQGAVTEALGQGDTTTGELPEGVFASVNEQYRAIEGTKGKNEARKYLQDQMLASVGNLDAVGARGYSDLLAKLSAAGGSKAPATPADPTAAFVQRVAALRLALTIVEAERPEGVDDAKIEALVNENTEAVQAKLAYDASDAEDKGDAPEVSPVVRAAFKAASGKATGGSRAASSGVRRNIGKHILSAFAEVEVGGFLTIAEIANHKSEEYGDDSPSQGAISARLFPTTTLDGIEPVEKGAIDGKNPKGARKVA